MKNEFELLENGNQFYMDDIFTGNAFLFDKGPDGSASIQIIDKNANKLLSICLWPEDLNNFVDFIKKDFNKAEQKTYYKQSTLDEDNDNWNVSPSDFNR